MPFKSEKQRRYMHKNLPKIAKRWEEDYKRGGIVRLTRTVPPKRGPNPQGLNVPYKQVKVVKLEK
jgi:hypothetical protein